MQKHVHFESPLISKKRSAASTSRLLPALSPVSGPPSSSIPLPVSKARRTSRRRSSGCSVVAPRILSTSCSTIPITVLLNNRKGIIPQHGGPTRSFSLDSFSSVNYFATSCYSRGLNASTPAVIVLPTRQRLDWLKDTKIFISRRPDSFLLTADASTAAAPTNHPDRSSLQQQRLHHEPKPTQPLGRLKRSKSLAARLFHVVFPRSPNSTAKVEALLPHSRSLDSLKSAQKAQKAQKAGRSTSPHDKIPFPCIASKHPILPCRSHGSEESSPTSPTAVPPAFILHPTIHHRVSQKPRKQVGVIKGGACVEAATAGGKKHTSDGVNYASSLHQVKSPTSNGGGIDAVFTLPTRSGDVSSSPNTKGMHPEEERKGVGRAKDLAIDSGQDSQRIHSSQHLGHSTLAACGCSQRVRKKPKVEDSYFTDGIRGGVKQIDEKNGTRTPTRLFNPELSIRQGSIHTRCSEFVAENKEVESIPTYSDRGKSWTSEWLLIRREVLRGGKYYKLSGSKTCELPSPTSDLSGYRRLPTSLSFPMSTSELEEEFGDDFCPKSYSLAHREENNERAPVEIRRVSLKEFSGLENPTKSATSTPSRRIFHWKKSVDYPDSHQQATSYVGNLLNKISYRRRSSIGAGGGGVSRVDSAHGLATTASNHSGKVQGSFPTSSFSFDTTLEEINAAIRATQSKASGEAGLRLSTQDERKEPTLTTPKFEHLRNRMSNARIQLQLHTSLESGPGETISLDLEQEKLALFDTCKEMVICCKGLVKLATVDWQQGSDTLYASAEATVTSAEKMAESVGVLIRKRGSLLKPISAKVDQKLATIQVLKTVADMLEYMANLTTSNADVSECVKKMVECSAQLMASITQLILEVRAL